ncbi:single-stranded DNA-binding protein [Vibrio owensii]|uniref:single-stranded DNA-binding protein n=1 Tax=Vibrio owensii TaxID=696485 RepID=UPI0040684EEE
MKPLRANTGFIGGTVTSCNVDNGQTIIWVDQVTRYLDASQQEQQRTAQLQCVWEGQYNFNQGDSVLFKVMYQKTKLQGNNGSQVDVAYYRVLDCLAQAPSGSYLSVNSFTLGGNVGSVEEKNSNGKTWYNVTVALTTSFKDENDNWQDTTHWARISINQKMMATNFKQGLHKGDSVLIECEVTTNSGTDQYQNNVLYNEFRLNRVLGQVAKAEFEALKNTGQQQNGYNPQNQPAQSGGHQQSAPQGRYNQPNPPKQQGGASQQPSYQAPSQRSQAPSFRPQGQQQGFNGQH